VVIRSTVTPRTVRNAEGIDFWKKASGLRAGVDFSVAVAPEFLREETAIEDFFSPLRLSSVRFVARVALLFEEVEGPLSITSIESRTWSNTCQTLGTG
jgi:GDP-mannose 6-dehydrogenase